VPDAGSGWVRRTFDQRAQQAAFCTYLQTLDLVDLRVEALYRQLEEVATSDLARQVAPRVGLVRVVAAVCGGDLRHCACGQLGWIFASSTSGRIAPGGIVPSATFGWRPSSRVSSASRSETSLCDTPQRSAIPLRGVPLEQPREGLGLVDRCEVDAFAVLDQRDIKRLGLFVGLAHDHRHLDDLRLAAGAVAPLAGDQPVAPVLRGDDEWLDQPVPLD
jgi:hypothetical protein